jgi:hypothetical protein
MQEQPFTRLDYLQRNDYRLTLYAGDPRGYRVVFRTTGGYSHYNFDTYGEAKASFKWFALEFDMVGLN